MRVAVYGLVSGRVQGVGFRYFVKDHADVAGVDGFAKNLSNGQVEVLLCGAKSDIEQVKVAVERGPAGSHVSSVAWDDTEMSIFGEFTIG